MTMDLKLHIASFDRYLALVSVLDGAIEIQSSPFHGRNYNDAVFRTRRGIFRIFANFVELPSVNGVPRLLNFVDVEIISQYYLPREAFAEVGVYAQLNYVENESENKLEYIGDYAYTYNRGNFLLANNNRKDLIISGLSMTTPVSSVNIALGEYEDSIEIIDNAEWKDHSLLGVLDSGSPTVSIADSTLKSYKQ